MSYVRADGIGDDRQTPDGFPVNEYAHGQLASRLNIPKKYYDRMRQEAPMLLDQNVGHWFLQKPERRMFRTLDGYIRAVLSDRYRRLDDIDMLQQAILPVFEETPGLQVQVCALTPERMHIVAYLPGLTDEVKVGDIVCAGVSIRNSEVGAGAMVAEPRLLRLICMNGMTVSAAAMRKFHIGRRAAEDSDEALDVFSDETLAADDHATFLKCRDIVRAALDEVKFHEIVTRMQETATTEAVKPIAAVEVLANRYSFKEDEQDTILQHLIQGGDLSQWGVLNAVTRAAQDMPDYARQHELEVIGGELAMMPSKEWKDVVAA